jgi:hypothetical protein
MPTMALTCTGCGGRNLRDVRDESDMVVKVVGNRVSVPIPLPLLCLDCGGTDHRYVKVE